MAKKNELIHWREETRLLADLVPYENNPRKITKAMREKLTRSLQEDGYHSRILIDTQDRIIGGHMRAQVMQDMGIKEVGVLVPNRDLTPEEFDRINLRDNVEFGEWDGDKLLERFDKDFLLDIGVPDIFGPDKDKVVNDPDGDPDEAGEAPAHPKTVVGDLYEIGPHRLLCGSTTVMTDMDKLCDGQKVDQVVTDPPYNVDYEGKTKKKLKIQNDKMENGDFEQFLRDSYASMDAHMKPGAVFYIWHADSEGLAFRAAAAAVGWVVRQCLIWQKDTMVMGRQDYHWKHEPCLYGWKDGAAHLWATDRKQTTLLEFKRPSRNAEHPTMKPVELISYQIGNNTKQEDIVLDGFGGSGTTMVAAHMLGRRAYLMELDPAYCDVIVTRMRKLYPDLPLRRNGEEIDWVYE